MIFASIAGVIVLLLLYIIFTYNGFIRKRSMVQEGWSGIDVQLKRRADLIPSLVDTVKAYVKHEKEVLENVTSLRARSAGATDMNERGAAESMITGALTRLFAVAENYPELKANENFRALQDQLAETENMLEDARRYYNATARDLNIKVESFPSNLIATLFKFEKATFFQLEDPADRKVPKTIAQS